MENINKKCNLCKLEKPISDYNKNRSRKDGYQTRCKICDRKRAITYFNSSEEQQKKALLRKKERLQKSQNAICKYLSNHPCVDCGETDILLLEFDHIDPDQKFDSVTVMVADGFRWSKIEEEINKCVIRCLICHRKRTANQQNNYRLRWLFENK